MILFEAFLDGCTAFLTWFNNRFNKDKRKRFDGCITQPNGVPCFLWIKDGQVYWNSGECPRNPYFQAGHNHWGLRKRDRIMHRADTLEEANEWLKQILTTLPRSH